MTRIESKVLTAGSFHVESDCKCTACGADNLTDIFESTGAPVHVGVFYDSRQEARRAPTGDITLAYCHECGFIHNRRFDPNKIAYEPGYEVSLQHSPTFRTFMEGVAERLIERFGLHRSRVLEIGAGSGYFLTLLSELGANDCVGIDPTVANKGLQKCGSGQIRLIRNLFDEKSAKHLAAFSPDFVCCLSVFEDIPRPALFLSVLRSMLGESQAVMYFEVFNAYRAFQCHESWSVHYEQCNYFSASSLVRLFRQAGFRVLDADTCYEGDQYLYVDATTSDVPHDVGYADDACSESPEVLRDFDEVHREKVAKWRAKLNHLVSNKQRVVVWGTGGKGISFLNSLDSADAISYVVEINPDKQGRYVPGSGQLIVPPEFLKEYQPHTVIITNRLYEQEMKRQATELGVNCEFEIA